MLERENGGSSSVWRKSVLFSITIFLSLFNWNKWQLILHPPPEACPTHHQAPPPPSCISTAILSFLPFPISSPCIQETPHLPSPIGCFHGLFPLCITLFLFLSAKLLRTQLNSLLVFFIFSPQEQVEETYIMIKPDGVQRGLVSFNYIYLS